MEVSALGVYCDIPYVADLRGGQAGRLFHSQKGFYAAPQREASGVNGGVGGDFEILYFRIAADSELHSLLFVARQFEVRFGFGAWGVRRENFYDVVGLPHREPAAVSTVRGVFYSLHVRPYALCDDYAVVEVFPARRRQVDFKVAVAARGNGHGEHLPFVAVHGARVGVEFRAFGRKVRMHRARLAAGHLDPSGNDVFGARGRGNRLAESAPFALASLHVEHRRALPVESAVHDFFGPACIRYSPVFRSGFKARVFEQVCRRIHYLPEGLGVRGGGEFGVVVA